MEVAPRFWQSPQTLDDIYVSTSGGAMSGTEWTAAAPGAFRIKGSGAGATPAASPAQDTGATTGSAAANYRLNQLTNSTGGTSTGTALTTAREPMMPLSAFSYYGPGLTPLAVNHQGPFVAATISFNLARGQTLGTALVAIEQTMRQLHVPIAVHGEFAGTAMIFQQTQMKEPLLILGSLLTVYIVLGILYESLTQPLTILSTLPSSGIGAIVALLLFGEQFTLIALIAVILLIGVVLKNAIMMVDVALETQRAGHESAAEAIHAACILRFRPIMMTTIAAMFGALPLALMSGQGSELRRPLGIAIVGGLLLSQMLTLFTTPVVYLFLDRFRRRRAAPDAAPVD
jgi:multidrug efflux pump